VNSIFEEAYRDFVADMPKATKANPITLESLQVQAMITKAKRNTFFVVRARICVLQLLS